MSVDMFSHDVIAYNSAAPSRQNNSAALSQASVFPTVYKTSGSLHMVSPCNLKRLNPALVPMFPEKQTIIPSYLVSGVCKPILPMLVPKLYLANSATSRYSIEPLNRSPSLISKCTHVITPTAVGSTALERLRIDFRSPCSNATLTVGVVDHASTLLSKPKPSVVSSVITHSDTAWSPAIVLSPSVAQPCTSPVKLGFLIPFRSPDMNNFLYEPTFAISAHSASVSSIISHTKCNGNSNLVRLHGGPCSSQSEATIVYNASLQARPGLLRTRSMAAVHTRKPCVEVEQIVDDMELTRQKYGIGFNSYHTKVCV